MNIKQFRLLLTFVILATLPSVYAIVDPWTAISGMVTYLPHVALPPDSQVSVNLIDLTANPPIIVSNQSFTTSKQVPIPFAVPIDIRWIDEGRNYGLEAEIRDADENLILQTSEPFLVLTHGNPISLLGLVLEIASQ